MTYKLIDTFNRRTISTHRTLDRDKHPLAGGKIDLAFYVRYLPEQRARIFSHPIRYTSAN
jgi:hypothetical protein